MKNFVEDAKRLFGTDNLYYLLGCSKESDESEIKRAFYRSSLKYHPDKSKETDKSLATEQFQIISRAFAILSEEGSRTVYDQTGIIGDYYSEKSFEDWCEYFNHIFPKFTENDIEEAKKKFIGNQEEKDEIAKAYERYKGDMDKIMETVVFAEVFEEDRIRKIIQDLIDEKRVESYDAFVKEPAKKRTRRLKRAQQEAAAFEMLKCKKRAKGGDEDTPEDSLVVAIQKRQAAADKFIDQLAAKYGVQEKKKRPARKKPR